MWKRGGFPPGAVKAWVPVGPQGEPFDSFEDLQKLAEFHGIAAHNPERATASSGAPPPAGGGDGCFLALEQFAVCCVQYVVVLYCHGLWRQTVCGFVLRTQKQTEATRRNLRTKKKPLQGWWQVLKMKTKETKTNY